MPSGEIPKINVSFSLNKLDIASTLLELLPLLTGKPPSHSSKYFKGNLNNSFFPMKLIFFCSNKLLANIAMKKSTQ